jgi:hypothetical protein
MPQRVRIGHVVIQEREVELDVNCFLEQLPGEIEPRLRRVHVFIQIENQVIGDD